MESLASMPVLGWVALAAFVGFVAWRVIATRDKAQHQAVAEHHPTRVETPNSSNTTRPCNNGRFFLLTLCESMLL